MKNAYAIVQRSERDDYEHPGIVQALVECLRRPSALEEVGAGGVEGRGLLAQLAVMFLGVAFLSGAAEASLKTHADAGVLFQGLQSLAVAPIGLLAGTIAIWVVAAILSGTTRFRDVLTGLLFLSVLTSVITLPFALAGAAIGATMLGSACTLLAMIVSLVYYLYFLKGMFDVGWLAAFGLAFVVAFIQGAVTTWMAAMLLVILA